MNTAFNGIWVLKFRAKMTEINNTDVQKISQIKTGKYCQHILIAARLVVV